MARKSGKSVDGDALVNGDGHVDSNVAPVVNGNGIGGVETIDPAALGNASAGTTGDSDSGTGRRKRGRPPGPSAGTATKSEEIRYSVSGVETLLISVHEILAKAVRVDLLKIDKAEANALSKAIGEVSKHYPVKVDPKLAAWTNLVAVAASVYGPRLAVAQVMAKAARAERIAAEEAARNRGFAPEYAS